MMHIRFAGQSVVTFPKRFLLTMGRMHVEVAEIVTIGLALSQYQALVVNGDALSMSPFHRAIQDAFPHSWMVWTMGTLLAITSIGMVIGGMHTENDNSANRPAPIVVFWYKWRTIAMFFNFFVWLAMAVLSSRLAITPGSGVYFYLGVGFSAFGVGRFLLLCKAEQNTRELRDVSEEGDKLRAVWNV